MHEEAKYQLNNFGTNGFHPKPKIHLPFAIIGEDLLLDNGGFFMLCSKVWPCS